MIYSLLFKKIKEKYGDILVVFVNIKYIGKINRGGIK